MINYFYKDSLFDLINNASLFDSPLPVKTTQEMLRDASLQGISVLVKSMAVSCFAAASVTLITQNFKRFNLENEEVKDIEIVKDCVIVPVIEELAALLLQNGIGLVQNCVRGDGPVKNKVVGWLTSPVARILAVQAASIGYECYKKAMFKNFAWNVVISGATLMYPGSAIYEKEKNVLAPVVACLVVSLSCISTGWLFGSKVYFLKRQIA